MDFVYLCDSMRLRIPVILSLALLLTAPQALAQYYTTGSAPASVRWSQIKGDHFTVIFPREIDSLAREYLFAFESTRDATLAGLHINTPRMPIVLQPYNMNSNGSVAWAPRRIELYTTPPGNPLYPLDWETQLAVHEGRHVGQFAHYIRGALFPFQILAGEQGFALAFPSSTQMEGDAVQHETDITGTGRGRDPEFLKYYRAAFLADDFRSYDHWRYGSYRYYTPNKYAFGYLITSTMRYHSGNYFTTGDLLEEKVHSWWRVFSQSHRSYIKASGQTVRKNWREAIANYNASWRWDYLVREPYSRPEPVLKGRSKFYAEFNNPLPFENGVYATMTGLPFERRLVRIDTLGKYHYVRPFSASTSSLVKDGDHAFVFSEVVPDPRWELRSWSVIRRYDTRSGRMETLTHRTRYVNPSVSPDGKILAAEYSVTGGSDAVVLDPQGQLLERIPAPENGQIVNFVQLGDVRYATVITKEGESIWRHDGSWTRMTAPQKRMIRELQADGDSLLYFVTDLDGLSNVYAYSPSSGSLRRWVNAPFSADKPYLDTATGTLYYASYDHLGYLPYRLSKDKFDGVSASFDQTPSYPIADRTAEQMGYYVEPRTEAEDEALRKHLDSLETRPYSKILHGFRFHSWAPFYANIDRIMNDLSGFNFNNLESIFQFVAPGVTLLSQNNQGTLVTTLGYSYYKRHHAGHAYMKYSGLYPVIEAAFDFNERNRTHQVTDLRPGSPAGSHIDVLSQPAYSLNVQVSVPLHFSKGGWNTSVVPRMGYAMTNDSFLYITPKETVNGQISQLLTADLLVDTRLSRATSRLTPRLGFGVEISGQTRLDRQSIHNSVGALRAYTYLPGFRAEDGVKLSYFRQYQPENSLFYSPAYNLVRRPFGYDNTILMDYHRLLLEYALPIYAGDINGGFFFYLKRIILIPFVDVARDLRAPTLNDDNNITGFGPRNFLSYGTRLMLNTYLFRIGSEFKIGVQYSRMYDSDKWGTIRLVFSTGL